MTEETIAILTPHLVREEGFVSHCYNDHLGFRTIGIGRMVDQRLGGGITRDEAEYLLRNDIARRSEELLRRIPWIKSLDPVRQAVLISMSFQMGVEGLLKFKNTLKAVSEERWVAAANGMRASRWARQTPARALRVAMAMETGEAVHLT
jgi:lysozyme